MGNDAAVKVAAKSKDSEIYYERDMAYGFNCKCMTIVEKHFLKNTGVKVVAQLKLR